MSFDKLNDSPANGNIHEDTALKDKLYALLDEKGMIANLRAQIRQQIITLLQEPNSWNTKKQNISSPKIQAFNLLIADYLIYQENLFTLSVFMAEVPLLENLKEYSTYVNGMGVSSNSSLPKPRFQLDEVQDILEALGVHPSSDVTKNICQIYFSGDDRLPLITSLFKGFSCIYIDQKIEEGKLTKIVEETKPTECSQEMMVDKLQKENEKLRELITIQRHRIEELSYKPFNLVEKTHQVIPNDYRVKNVKKKLTFKNLKPKNRLILQNSSIPSTTDYSTTLLESDNQTEDEMIREVTARLKRIKVNKSNVEQRFETFQSQRLRRNNNGFPI